MLKKLETLLAAFLLLATLLACKELNGAPGCSGSSAPALRDVDRALIAAWDFREISKRGYARGLLTYADASARAKLAELEARVWPVTDPKAGWAHFLETSVLCAGGAAGKEIPVAFYHPWSDVFLVLVWKIDAGAPRVTDAEVLIGDLVRRGSGVKLRAVRSYTEKAIYGPYAVGLATAESVKAFERTFAVQENSQGFRIRVSGLGAPELLEANHYAAGKQLSDSLAELAPLASGDGMAPALRAKLGRVFREVARGNVAALTAEASATPAQSAKTLREMKLEDWRRMKPVAFSSYGDASLLMLSNAGGPDTFIALKLEKDGDDLRVRRIDVLSFKKLVENSSTLEQGMKP